MDQILRRRLPPRKPKEKPKQRPVPVFVNFAHTRQFAVRHRNHQLMVGIRVVRRVRHPLQQRILTPGQKVTKIPALCHNSSMHLREYLETSYRPDCDFLEGELLERNVGEWDHSRLQVLLSSYLSLREAQWGILVAIEQRAQVKATRFRVPDITVLTGPPPTGGIVTEPPFLCIEILSPSDRIGEMQGPH